MIPSNLTELPLKHCYANNAYRKLKNNRSLFSCRHFFVRFLCVFVFTVCCKLNVFSFKLEQGFQNFFSHGTLKRGLEWHMKYILHQDFTRRKFCNFCIAEPIGLWHTQYVVRKKEVASNWQRGNVATNWGGEIPKNF